LTQSPLPEIGNLLPVTISNIIGGSIMPRLLVRLFAEEAAATQRLCCIHTSAERSQKAMRLLIHANP
jgi:hypothetical protein